MGRIITAEETKELFRFCHKHYVYQYDLQIELVDHLASSIEELWKEDPELPFQKALMNTFGKFGIYGFSKIRQQKEKELRKKYNRMLWNYLLDYYRWPKLIVIVTFTFLMVTLLRIVENGLWVMAAYFIVLFIIMIYYHFKYFPEKYKIKLKKAKSFLLLDRLKEVQVASSLTIQLPIHYYNFSNILNLKSVDNFWVLLAISFFTVSFTILIYGNLFFLPEKIKEHFMEQFAEFAI
ncbi:MAG: hypothetical protein JXR31_07830 [Prolixibacteraceae bacterium]|nr:hypothetical protein [Prolixibacteraceae bacterium]MBN2774142.1 hypothetical protein [Prolixibacteraceae bacterium]